MKLPTYEIVSVLDECFEFFYYTFLEVRLKGAWQISPYCLFVEWFTTFYWQNSCISVLRTFSAGRIIIEFYKEFYNQSLATVWTPFMVAKVTWNRCKSIIYCLKVIYSGNVGWYYSGALKHSVDIGWFH